MHIFGQDAENGAEQDVDWPGFSCRAPGEPHGGRINGTKYSNYLQMKCRESNFNAVESGEGVFDETIAPTPKQVTGPQER